MPTATARSGWRPATSVIFDTPSGESLRYVVRGGLVVRQLHVGGGGRLSGPSLRVGQHPAQHAAAAEGRERPLEEGGEVAARSSGRAAT